MAGKITDLTALTGANLATGDLFEVLDVSDTTLAATGTNKSITASELAIGIAPKFTTSIVSTVGTITADTPALTATQTWNNSGVTFDAILVNVTRTASSASSNLLRLRQGGTDWLRVGGNDGSGNVYMVTAAPFCNSNNNWCLDASFALRVGSNRGLFFSSTTSWAGTVDLGLARNAAGVGEINNGSVGTFRDLKLRSLIMTQGSGSVIILPTADPGVSGALWNNGGTIAISA